MNYINYDYDIIVYNYNTLILSFSFLPIEKRYQKSACHIFCLIDYKDNQDPKTKVKVIFYKNYMKCIFLT